jgi:hypothetical protein
MLKYHDKNYFNKYIAFKILSRTQKNEYKHKSTTTCLGEHVNDIASYY